MLLGKGHQFLLHLSGYVYLFAGVNDTIGQQQIKILVFGNQADGLNNAAL